MNIYDYADALNLEIKLLRYPCQSNRWTARFDGTETKRDLNDGCLTSTYGNGESPQQALFDYAQKITGKILVVGAMSETRRQYNVPALEVPQ